MHSRSHSRRLRARVWLHQLELDRALAGGVDSADSVELEVRAEQLRSAHFKRHLVAALDAALTKADHPPHWHSGGVPVRVAEVRAARPALEELRDELLSSAAPSLAGLARASCLLDDPQGPLYHACDPGVTLGQLAAEAASACRSGGEHSKGGPPERSQTAAPSPS
jgi:hypothetical protein